jgi:hypothetical protein
VLFPSEKSIKASLVTFILLLGSLSFSLQASQNDSTNLEPLALIQRIAFVNSAHQEAIVSHSTSLSLVHLRSTPQRHNFVDKTSGRGWKFFDEPNRSFYQPNSEKLYHSDFIAQPNLRGPPFLLS